MQRNSRETTAGASKRNGVRAKPQREHRNATEFARNHSGSIQTQRKSRETTAGASKPRPRPTARPVAVGNLSGPQKRPEEATRGRNSRETTAGASKPRPHPTARAVAVGKEIGTKSSSTSLRRSFGRPTRLLRWPAGTAKDFRKIQEAKERLTEEGHGNPNRSSLVLGDCVAPARKARKKRRLGGTEWSSCTGCPNTNWK